MKNAKYSLFFLLLLLTISCATLRWTFGPINIGQFTTTPLLTPNALVVAASDGTVYAIDKTTGSQSWSYSSGAEIKADPGASSSQLFFANNAGKIFSLSLDGKALWNRTLENGPFGLALADDASNGLFVTAPSGITKLDARDGAVLWFKPFPGFKTAPAYANGQVLFAVEDKFYSLNANNGSTIWGPTEIGQVWESDPTVAENFVVLGTADSKVYCLDIGSGKVKWTHETGAWPMSDPLISEGIVYIGSNDYSLYALDLQSGQQYWKADLGTPAFGQPAIFSGARQPLIIVSGRDNALYAFDRKDGAKLWSFGVGDRVTAPVADFDTIYFASLDKQAYALEPTAICNFESPKPGESIGDKELVLKGRAFSESGVKTVRLRTVIYPSALSKSPLRDLGWADVWGTESWTYTFDPSTVGADQYVVFECQIVSVGGGQEAGQFTSIGVIKSSNMPDSKMVVEAPDFVDPGQPFELKVKNEEGQPLSHVTVVFDNQVLEGNGTFTLSFPNPGEKVINISRKGYETTTHKVEVKGSTNLAALTIVFLALLVAIVAYFKIFRKKKKS